MGLKVGLLRRSIPPRGRAACDLSATRAAADGAPATFAVVLTGAARRLWPSAGGGLGVGGYRGR